MKKTVLKIFVLLFIFSSNNAFALPKDYPKCVNSDVNKSDYCPLEAKLGHTLIMVDFTSRWEKPQIDWVKGRIFGDALISSTPPYHRNMFTQSVDLRLELKLDLMEIK